MHIRPATATDLPAMRAIEERTASAAHWTEHEYRRLFMPDPPRLSLVAEEGFIQGFLVARQVGPEWEIENIAVSEEAQRRGVGFRLLADFLDLVRQQGAESVFLEVRESNAAARALYVKAGFTETGRRRRYYADPAEDAVLYRLRVRSTADRK
jgi:ribosomal-protein-alanine N-acetyltransferase